ncbi:hypothetical protein HHK36_007190 [Tetracentron sinense]|uniref:Uncharacterized protein n=1 Tax=Tetracentron sinense TaxID=13715 RepID=A0A835DPQ9_TETSI|nr:hypothetical protein HHK36_007190 [Tetracentron sinense]
MKVMESRGVPRQQACTSRLASEGSNLLPTIGICYLTFNTVVAIFRAYAHDDIPMIAFVLFLYGGFISLYSCMMALDQLPRNEESRRKDLLKIIIWILFTSLNFGIAIRFAMLLYPIASVIIFAMATVSSVSAFYFFFIYRAENASAGNFCSDKKIKSTQVFSPSPERVGDNKISALESSISPLEKSGNCFGFEEFVCDLVTIREGREGAGSEGEGKEIEELVGEVDVFKETGE